MFSKNISQKTNVIAWQVFELTYYDVVLQHIGYYATEIHTSIKMLFYVIHGQMKKIWLA